MAICELRGVFKSYLMGEVEVPALKGVDVQIDAGEFTVFSGPSGSGKSTLLNLIGLLDVPTRGQVLMDGQDVGKLRERELGALRAKKIGFIFQSFNLIPVLTAFENVELALRLSGDSTVSERRQKVEASLIEVGLKEYMNRRPSQLSGGQQQRVAIARALVKEPALVIADEPTANLDSKNSGAILEMMNRLNQEHDATFLFSTHDPMVVEQARRVVYMLDGEVLREEHH
ncbi:MAG: putative ABC transport system ATP-binding protein [Myxococcota bacterium]|jgi:putative ABC transport system ATP-binding protein